MIHRVLAFEIRETCKIIAVVSALRNAAIESTERFRTLTSYGSPTADKRSSAEREENPA
jgi:hypothetical protein